MIQIDNITKTYPVRTGMRTVLDQVNLTIERGQKIGILGRNGSGKSTLIRLISGAEWATKGTIWRKMSVSWPLAFTGAFAGNQSALDCVRFICRIYGIKKESINEKIEFVESFAELGAYFREPLQTYSTGMAARFAFAMSMAIDFDCFLIDEVMAAGDDRFHKKCYEELFIKRKDRAFVIVSHDASYIKKHCDVACVLLKGKLYPFETIDEAYNFYQSTSIGELSRKDVIAAYRFILDREPEGERVIQHCLSYDSFDKLRKAILLSQELEHQLLSKSADDGRNIEMDLTKNHVLETEDIILGYRLILGRIPQPHELVGSYTANSLRSALMATDEFHQELKRLSF